MASNKNGTEDQPIGVKVAIKNIAKNPESAMKTRAHLGEKLIDSKKKSRRVSHDKNNLEVRLQAESNSKNNILDFGGTLVAKLVMDDQTNNPGKPVADSYFTVLYEMGVDTKLNMTNDDVDDILDWCKLPGGGSVAARLRTRFENDRTAMNLPGTGVAILPPTVAAAAVGNPTNLGAIGATAPGLSMNARFIVVPGADDSSDEEDSSPSLGTKTSGLTEEMNEEEEEERPGKKQKVEGKNLAPEFEEVGSGSSSSKSKE